MYVRLSVHGPDPTQQALEFRSLCRWLTDDGGLRGTGITVKEVGDEPAPGEMGGTFEVLRLLAEHGPNWGALAVAVVSWRDARAARGALRVAREDSDTDSVTLTAADLRDPDALRRALERLEELAREERAGRERREGEDTPPEGDA
ncbi:effector-associated constant component EACC1 [Actinomycetota bacterium Odt1-20B]